MTQRLRSIPLSGTSQLVRAVPPLRLRLRTLALVVLALGLLRYHRCLRFPRSVQPPPGKLRPPLTPDAAPPVSRFSSELGPAVTTPPRFRHRSYAFDASIVVSLQSSSCLSPDLVLPGLFLLRSRPWLLTTAAEGGLEPAPASRFRGAYPHQLNSKAVSSSPSLT